MKTICNVLFLLETLFWRRLGLKHGLSVLCLVAFGNLSGAQNYNSLFNFNFNISPYPWAKTNSESIQEKNVTVEKISDNNEKYCLKPECIHTASRILNYMDASLEPCDNFYKFACGQYMREQEISDDIYVNNNFIIIEEKIKQKMKRILEQDLKPAEPKYVKLMKTFYRNCMNSARDVEELKSKMAVNVITKINGWSYLKNSLMANESFYWEKYLAKIMQETGISETFFFKTSLEIDMHNNSYYDFWVNEPSELAPTNFSSIKYFLPELKKRNLPFEDLIVRIQEIENMLINISKLEDDEQSYYNRMTVKELEGNYSNILWREIFNGMLQPVTEVGDDDIVLVSESTFFKKFIEHIKNISKRDQAIYLIWTAIKEIFKEDELQIPKKEELWKKCFKLTKDSFISAVGALYMKKYVNEETNDKHIDEMITNIFHQFNISIKNVDWLDQKTKDYALEKLSSLYAQRQNMFQISEDKEIDEFFTNLEITEGDFYESVFNTTKFKKALLSTYVRVPLNRSSMLHRMDATDVNAYNDLMFNSFGISPGFLQGIFFNESRPMYMNYGAIGTTVGHELAHGFDTEGKDYDKNGNYLDWWKPTSEKQFAEKAQCFISQYQNYTVEDINLNINGIKTQAENIADNEGLKITYFAYQKWVKDHGSEPLLPGLNFTQSQLFWISFAQASCQKASLKYQKAYLNIKSHSLPEFRIIGSLSNRPEFAKDFQCPNRSRMIPKKKCSLW